jgi:fumarate reductase flavoprotein subunit
MAILSPNEVEFEVSIPVLIIGGGACGLVAALAARDQGAQVLVLERDSTPSGSTALSSGMIPAAGSNLQQGAGVTDSPQLMAADIQAKAKGRAAPDIVETVCRISGPTIDWLVDKHGIELELVGGFLYPKHSALRMHAPPSRTGAALIGNLLAAVEAAGIDVLTDACVTDLFGERDGRVRGLRIARPDGSTETIGCETLILACNGFGGNPEMVRHYIPEMAEAEYFGHTGNQGDAVLWGVELGGEVDQMTAYQGHGSVATPQGILVTWALMMEGGIQVNSTGQRFSNEHHGYSEQSVAVLAQPGKVAWNIFDERLHAMGQSFDDYRNAITIGAIKRADTVEELAEIIGAPVDAVAAGIDETKGADTDHFGRDMSATQALEAPFYVVKVTGALFHTQGGLRIDTDARVLRKKSNDGMANLFAGGGAACGVSGPDVSGYLSGNGLLTAVMLGRIAGTCAACQVLG